MMFVHADVHELMRHVFNRVFFSIELYSYEWVTRSKEERRSLCQIDASSALQITCNSNDDILKLIVLRNKESRWNFGMLCLQKWPRVQTKNANTEQLINKWDNSISGEKESGFKRGMVLSEGSLAFSGNQRNFYLKNTSFTLVIIDLIIVSYVIHFTKPSLRVIHKLGNESLSSFNFMRKRICNFPPFSVALIFLSRKIIILLRRNGSLRFWRKIRSAQSLSLAIIVISVVLM